MRLLRIVWVGGDLVVGVGKLEIWDCGLMFRLLAVGRIGIPSRGHPNRTGFHDEFFFRVGVFDGL